jgi:hypothetical protein
MYTLQILGLVVGTVIYWPERLVGRNEFSATRPQINIVRAITRRFARETLMGYANNLLAICSRSWLLMMLFGWIA